MLLIFLEISRKVSTCWKCRGQSFDGATNRSGRLNGLQKQILDIQPKALYIHCLAHSLSLSFQDSLNQINECRDSINFVKDLVNFIRDSPKRLSWFSTFQADDSTSLRPLCPTRWTMRASSVSSLLDNYTTLISFFEEIPRLARI